MRQLTYLVPALAVGMAPAAWSAVGANAGLALAMAGEPVAAAAGEAAAALSNQAFAAQVRVWRERMASDGQVVAEAALLCVHLPEHRAVEEPQCVALRGHLRAQMAKTPGRERSGLGRPERWSIDELGGWLGRALGLGLGRDLS